MLQKPMRGKFAIGLGLVVGAGGLATVPEHPAQATARDTVSFDVDVTVCEMLIPEYPANKDLRGSNTIDGGN